MDVIYDFSTMNWDENRTVYGQGCNLAVAEIFTSVCMSYDIGYRLDFLISGI